MTREDIVNLIVEGIKEIKNNELPVPPRKSMRFVVQSFGMIILFDDKDNIVKTYQNISEILKDKNNVPKHYRELSPKMIQLAKKTNNWESNPYDLQYGGKIKDWDKFRKDAKYGK